MLKLNEVYLGDSLELYKQLDDNSIDLIVTDPPYIVDTAPAGKSSVGYLKKLAKKVNKNNFHYSNNSDIDFISNGFNINKHLSEWQRVLKKFNAFIFCSNKQISSLMKWGENRGYITTCLIWWKYNAPPLVNGSWKSDIEYIIHIREKGAIFQGNHTLKSKVYQSPIEISKYGHPTEKPLKLIKQFIQVGSNENDIVLDPFCGSGTTLHGTYELKRKYIGFEIEEKFYNITKDRLKRATGKVGLFENI